MQPRDDNAIHAEMNLEELLSRFPASVQVFVNRRMHCFGCPIAQFETIAEACAIYSEPLQSMLADLTQAVQSANTGDSGARA